MEGIIQGLWPKGRGMIMLQPDFEREAQAAWSALSAKAGMARKAPVRVLSARKGNKQRWRVVARVEGETPFIVKFWSVNGAQKARHAFEALECAQDALGPYEKLSSPMPIAWDSGTGSVLMSLCPGISLRDVLMDGGEVDIAKNLKPALAWMAALHAGSLRSDMPFGGIKKLHALQRAGDAGNMPERARFNACLDRLARLAEDAEQMPNPTAIVHGDLTLSNILVQGHEIAGIDFNNITQTSVALDLAMMFVEVAVTFAQDRDVPAFALLPEDWDAMVKQSYEGLSLQSANFRFFAGVRLLRMWAQTQPRIADHSLRRAHIWHGTQITAERLLLGET